MCYCFHHSQIARAGLPLNKVTNNSALAEESIEMPNAAFGLVDTDGRVSPTLTIADAAAPNVTLTLIVWTLTGGALLLFPSLIYLFRIFKRQR